jgi:hypothetical protein
VQAALCVNGMQPAALNCSALFGSAPSISFHPLITFIQ